MDKKLKVKFKIKMNSSKTKIMVVSRWKENAINIKVGEVKIKEVKEFNTYVI